MATAGDARAPYESGGAGEKRPFRSENSTEMSSDQGENATTGISELERKSKQPTFTRSKIRNPTTTENLPDELLINIFMRLFARQLAQMRSMSKCWNVLLSDPSFVKSHLHRSNHHNNNQQTLLVFNHFKPFTQYYSCESPHLEPTNFIKIKHTSIYSPKMVIGSVNGLVCVSGHTYSNIRIWNPSLSAVSAIPPPHTYISFCLHNMRFGFDPKTDDYKLVRIYGVHGQVHVKEWLPVEVYSMRKRSWEFITQPFPSHITRILDADYLCVDGHDGFLHWQSQVEKEETIVAFDLGSETFREIPLPDSRLYSNIRMYSLGVLGGKLCEMTRRDDGSWEVWVMEEYGVPESWVKRHVFSQFNDASCLYGFTSRNELVFRDKDGRLALYDPIANKTKKTRTKQIALKIVEYVDSLVWV